jgi:D-alanine-D-alanine ligase
MRGGPSAEYEISLQTGGNVLSALRGPLAEKYIAQDILIDKQGNWHIDGMPVSPYDIAHRFDVIFNALHGTYGEDGKVQQILEVHGIPFTGSGSLASAVGMNKGLSKNVYKNHRLKTPLSREIPSLVIIGDIGSNDVDGKSIRAEAIARELFTTFPMPAVIKPMSAGSSVGISIVRTMADIAPALTIAAKHGDSVIIEEYIAGQEATVGVIEGFRGQELYVLPVIEIKPKTGFFDYDAKYAGAQKAIQQDRAKLGPAEATEIEIVPGNFSSKIKEELAELTKKAHQALGLRHYSRSDFIISPRRGIYILETNTLPGLTAESLIPKALRSVGSDTHELVEHLIELALKK